MGAFMISKAYFFIGAHYVLAFFQAGGKPLHAFGKLDHGYGVFVCPGGQKCSFVYQVGQVGADEARGHFGYRLDVHGFVDVDLLHVYPQNLFAPAHIGPIDQDMAIETSGPKQTLSRAYWDGWWRP